MPFIPDENKSDWERGKDALEVLLQNFPVDSLETLAIKVDERPELVPQFSALLQHLDDL